MKRNIFIKGLAAVAAAAMFTACSSDYLDLKPVTDVTDAEVTATTEGAALAINALARSMQTQWNGLQNGMNQNANGENLLNTMYGEAMGADNMPGLSLAVWGPEQICGGAPWTRENYVLNYLPWKYAYTLIQQANQIIVNIDNAEGSEADRQFIKAQALTFRAHGYTRLVQFYAPRWEDSNNGDFYCAVKRLDGETGSAPLWKMSEVLDQIYADLNEAIQLYETCGKERTQRWHPDVNVANGLLARAALIKHDWATAKDAAAKARKGYQVMDNDTYFGGFLADAPNSVLWTQSTEPGDIYYFSFGAHFGVNGTYTQAFALGAGAISLDLYNQLDENDVRRRMYLTPDKMEVMPDNYNPGKITKDEWWNSKLVVTFSAGMDLSKGPFARKDAIDGKWGLYNVALRYCKYYGENYFTGNYEQMSNEGFLDYYTLSNKGDVMLARGEYGTLVTIPFGAQYKFWGEVPYGNSSYPFMRAAEMCLIEAEAAYELGDEATAKSCLMEINGKRIPGYTCDKGGTALRDEIRLCRRIELWGEGFNWLDFKRWNLPIERRGWVENDPTSGNWMVDFAHNTPTDVNHGWRLMIPRAEINYNPGIDRNLIVPNDDPNIW